MALDDNMLKVRKTTPSKKAQMRDELIPARSKDILVSRNPDLSLNLISIKQDRFVYKIDGLAAQAFWLMKGTATLREIKSKLAVGKKRPANLKQDFEKFTEWLLKEKLIVLREKS